MTKERELSELSDVVYFYIGVSFKDGANACATSREIQERK